MFSSIRVKLTLWYIGVLTMMLVGFAGVTYTLISQLLQAETDENLTEMARNISSSVGAEENDPENAAAPDTIISEALAEFRFRDYQFAIFNSANKLIAKTSDIVLPEDMETAVGSDSFGNILVSGEPFRFHETPLKFEKNNFKLYILHSQQDQIDLQDRLKSIFFVTVPLLLLFAGFGGYFLASKALKPIAEMSDRAKKITASNLYERLPIANENDELGDLAIVFNDLLDRLDREFDRQRRFMADASHELRTPLAIVRGESEVVLSKDDRTSAEYRESLNIVNDESRRLTKIVEDLFTLARADSGEFLANFGEVYLDEIVADCVRSIRTLADKRNIALEFTSDETQIRGDETLLRRLFLNLLDNAVKYNHENGTMKIIVENNQVRIANTGSEIPIEQRDLIFERFYRISKTRSLEIETLTSGAGLGLSIAKWIAELHNATIDYSRTDNDQNEFSVTFTR